MTDLAIIVVILGFAVLGYWTGLIRRVIGFVATYIAFLAATQAAPTAANVILQAQPGWAVPDALILGYFLIVILILLIFDVMATFYHARVQLAAIIVDRATGALVGFATGLMAVTVVLYLLLGGSQPPQGSPDGTQIQIRDGIRKATLAPALLRAIGQPAVILYQPVIPIDPGSYFNGQGSRPQ